MGTKWTSRIFTHRRSGASLQWIINKLAEGNIHPGYTTQLPISYQKLSNDKMKIGGLQNRLASSIAAVVARGLSAASGDYLTPTISGVRIEIRGILGMTQRSRVILLGGTLKLNSRDYILTLGECTNYNKGIIKVKVWLNYNPYGIS